MAATSTPQRVPLRCALSIISQIPKRKLLHFRMLVSSSPEMNTHTDIKSMPTVGTPPQLRHSSTTGIQPSANYINPDCVAPITFPCQLHLLLDDAEIKGFADVVSWLDGGTMFKVHKRKEFADRIMPCYFNQTRYKSFQRQLNSYRFHRMSAGEFKGTCFHELFMRDKPDLCKRMDRVQVIRGCPLDAAKQQILLLGEDVVAPSPNAPRLPRRRRESSEVDGVPEIFLRMFNSTEVGPLDCPSVAIFDDWTLPSQRSSVLS